MDPTLGELVAMETYRVCFKHMLRRKPENQQQEMLMMINCGSDYLQQISSFEMGVELAAQRFSS